MKKIIIIAALFCSFAASAQKTTPGNYTYIAQKYEWDAGILKGLGIPSGSGPAAFITGQVVRAGALYYDSIGTDSGFYVYTGTYWRNHSVSGGVWGSITGTLSDQTDLQSALNAKAPTASPTFTGTITTPLTASRAVVTGASSELTVAATTATEIGYVNGVTSAIQTQLNDKVTKSKVGPDFVVTNDSLFIQNAINVKKYGATGDGVTNDQPAIAAAIAAMSATQTLYFPAGNYLVSSTVIVNKSITIEGEPFARIKITGDFSAFTLAANVIKIHKLSFIGSGKAGGNTSQRGIDCNGSYYFDIAGCEFFDLNGIGLYWLNTDVAGGRYGGRVSNCNFNNNNVGFYSGEKGEYVTVTGGAAKNNTIGAVIAGGNVVIANMSISDNGIGLDYRTGTNNGHGSVIGCMINHNTTYNVKIHDVPLGVAFNGCQLFDSNVWLKNTDGVIFNGCELAPIAWFFENSKNTTISSSTFYTAYGFTVNNNYNSTTSSTYWTANTKLTGTQGWIEGTDITTTDGKVGDIVRYLEGSTASSATPTPTGNARDNTYVVTALATNATFGAPTGTAANNNRLLLRVKDNGIARTLAFNAIYTGILPTTTVVGETIYLPFVYNSTSVKWELVESEGTIYTTTDNNLDITGSVISTQKTVQTLTDGATITWDMSSGYNAEVTLGGNRTLSIPNIQEGDYGTITVFQDGTGGRTLAVPGGTIALNSAISDSTVLSFYYDGNSYAWRDNAKTILFRASTWATPTASDNITVWKTDVAITVSKVTAVVVGSSPSVTYQINFASDRSSGSPTTLFSSGQVTTSTTTGDEDTTFADATIPAGSYIWITTSAASGTITEMNVTIKYTND